ncbi:FecR domain-containing protein [Cytophagaceae bacterium DM2B3-1]|uniref:FecR domain-containing protein n=1 Tax=Xanthocytophaga flava TaxID=3048013 RepID=A0ABT7CEK4_9BACT|nr:FecR domain-containing protein [Xanthocytophaga flavus]MDJ1492169.1 FecR domain-containing protein [Xanthocytophaga flavus]
MRPQYHLFTIEDFLEDDFFLEWVKHRTQVSEEFWNDWITQQPPNLKEMQEAEARLRFLLSIQRITPSESLATDLWTRIQKDIDDQEEQVIALRPQRSRWILVAASIVALLVCVWILNTQYWGNEFVRTGYGQTRVITLPDSSVITLNANSSMSYPKRWKWFNDSRKVYLKGEALFHVKHLNQDTNAIKESERFVVRTDAIEVEVLGTVFNVKERRGLAQVALQTGRIQVKGLRGREISFELKPGESAKYDIQRRLWEKKDTAVESATAWTEQKLALSNTTVNDIIHELEDTYGYMVVLEDEQLGQRRIDGAIPMRNEKSILFVLSNILNVKIERKDSLLIFKKRKR